jgi:hypothetical protein
MLVTKKKILAAKELFVFIAYKKHSQYIKRKLSNLLIVFKSPAFGLKLLGAKITLLDVKGN